MFFGARRLFSVNFGQKTRKRTLLGSPGGPFRVFLAFFGQKTPKQTGMTNLGSPGVLSRSVSGFFDQNRKKSPGPEKHPKWLLLQKGFNSGIGAANYCIFHSAKKKSGDICPCRDQQKTAKKQPKNTTKNTMGHISVPWALPASCPPSPGRKLQENNPKTQQKNATGKYAFELFCYSIVRTDGISNTTCMPSVIYCISHFYFDFCSLRWHACAHGRAF